MIERALKTAEAVGVPPSYIVQEYLQRAVLLVLFDQVGVQGVLQGGSALRLFYESPRFSLDLDLIVEKAIRRMGTRLERLLQHYCQPHGITVRLHRWQRFEGIPPLIRAELRFTIPQLHRYLRLRTDLLVSTPPQAEPHLLTVNWLPGPPATIVPVRKPEGLLADKILALGLRAQLLVRDVFDTWLLLEREIRVSREEIEQELTRYRKTWNQLRTGLKRLPTLLSAPEAHTTALNRLLPPSSHFSPTLFQEMVKRVIQSLAPLCRSA